MQLPDSHPFFSTSSHIRELMVPLAKYDINYFTYTRNYHNGGRLYMGSRPEYLQKYISNKLYLTGNVEAKPQTYKKQAVLWSCLPNQRIFQFARENGIDHGIFLIQPSKNYCEFFAFGTSPMNYHVPNFFLNNLDFLKRFCFSFKAQASKLIELTNNSKIVLPYHNKALPHYTMSEPKLSCRKLTHRQKECIQMLLAGATSKEIAANLNINHRTVEDHINVLKNKFHARNKAELIVKLLDFTFR